ncbi:hypothetical protein BLOT_006432 [Blomia tropicalis]|nr:hypothetical protein BLOT_006432 [Blomia tropicalis]
MGVILPNTCSPTCGLMQIGRYAVDRDRFGSIDDVIRIPKSTLFMSNRVDSSISIYGNVDDDQ